MGLDAGVKFQNLKLETRNFFASLQVQVALAKIDAEPHSMSDAAKSLSLERKIKMQEAREGIINRLALTLPTTINLDRFLNVIVSELDA